MPLPGLSLVGFMGQQQAINHLRQQCIPAAPDDASLIAEWNAAKALVGAPFPNAGQPASSPIPASHAAHVAQVLAAPWVQARLGPQLAACTFEMIELAPLLAYQFTVDTDRSNNHCVSLSTPPKLDEIFELCLPLAPPPLGNLCVGIHPNSLFIKAQSLNVRTFLQGYFPGNVAGMAMCDTAGMLVGVTAALIHVTRLGGQSFLHNGYHRALGLLKAGVTHAPAIIRNASDALDAGIRPDGATFDLPLLQSANPPTLGHFAQGRAYGVSLRSMSRVLTINWAEYAIPDE